MKIPKHQAVELLNEKILIFEDILEKVSEKNIYDSNYKAIISETETLLAKLFTEIKKSLFFLLFKDIVKTLYMFS